MLLYTALHYAWLDNTTLHYVTLHYTDFTTANSIKITLSALHHNHSSTTRQLQPQLRYATLHPAVVGEVTGQVTIATMAAVPNKTIPTTFWSVSGFTLPSLIHNNQVLLQYRLPIELLKLPSPPCVVLLVLFKSIGSRRPSPPCMVPFVSTTTIL